MERPFEQWPSRFKAKILPKRKKWRLIVTNFTRTLPARMTMVTAWRLFRISVLFFEFENLKAVNLFLPGLASSSPSCCPSVPFPFAPGQWLIFAVNQTRPAGHEKMGRRRGKIKSIDCTFQATIVHRGRRTRLAVPILPTGWTVETARAESGDSDFDSTSSPVPSPGGCVEPLCSGTSETDTLSEGPTYSERQERLAESWAKIREELRRVAVSNNALPPGQICSVNECNQFARMRCMDCGS